MKAKFECLEDRLLLREIKDEQEKTQSGIDLSMRKKEVIKGEVVSIGEGRYTMDSGTFIHTVLKPKDIVLIGAGVGTEIDIPKEDGSLETVKLLRESDVLMKVGRKE